MVLEIGGRKYGLTGATPSNATSAFGASNRQAAAGYKQLQNTADDMLNEFSQIAFTEATEAGEVEGRSVQIQYDPVTNMPMEPESYDLGTYYGKSAHAMAQKRYFRQVDESISAKVGAIAAAHPSDPAMFMNKVNVEREAMLGAVPEGIRGSVDDAYRNNMNRFATGIAAERFKLDKQEDIGKTKEVVEQMFTELEALSGQTAALGSPIDIEPGEHQKENLAERKRVSAAILAELRDLESRHPDIKASGLARAAYRRIQGVEVRQKIAGTIRAAHATGVPALTINRNVAEVVTALRNGEGLKKIPEALRWDHTSLTGDDLEGIAKEIIQLQVDLNRGTEAKEGALEAKNDLDRADRTGIPAKNSAANQKELDNRISGAIGSKDVDYNNPAHVDVVVQSSEKYGIIPEETGRYLVGALSKYVKPENGDVAEAPAMAAAALFTKIKGSGLRGHNALKDGLNDDQYDAYHFLETVTRNAGVTLDHLETASAIARGERPIKNAQAKALSDLGTDDDRTYDQMFRRMAKKAAAALYGTSKEDRFWGSLLPNVTGKENGPVSEMFLGDLKMLVNAKMAKGLPMDMALKMSMEQVSKAGEYGESVWQISQSQAYEMRNESDTVKRMEMVVRKPFDHWYALEADRSGIKGLIGTGDIRPPAALVQAQQQLNDEWARRGGKNPPTIGKDARLAYTRSVNGKPLYTIIARDGRTRDAHDTGIVIDLRRWHEVAAGAESATRVKEAKETADRLVTLRAAMKESIDNRVGEEGLNDMRRRLQSGVLRRGNEVELPSQPQVVGEAFTKLFNTVAREAGVDPNGPKLTKEQITEIQSKVVHMGGGPLSEFLGHPVLPHMIPQHARFLMAHLVGSDREVTERSVTPAVQDVLRAAVARAVEAKRDYVTYEDYGNTSAGIPVLDLATWQKNGKQKERYPKDVMGLFNIIVDSYDPVMAASMSMGKFKFTRKDGQIHIEDTYDLMKSKSKNDDIFSVIRDMAPAGRKGFKIKLTLKGK